MKNFSPDNIDVLILAGGKGTRLQSAVSNTPKALAPIGREHPFLFYLLKYLTNHNFNKVTFATGHLSDQIEEYIQEIEKKNIFPQMTFNFSQEEAPLGTGGCIKLAHNRYHYQNLLVINGDTLFCIDLEDFISSTDQKDSIALHQTDNCSRFGSVKIDKDRYITQFLEKTNTHTSGLINGGIYFLTSELLDNLPEGSFSLEQEVFPKLANDKKLRGIPESGSFIDIGIPSDYLRAQELIPRWI